MSTLQAQSMSGVIAMVKAARLGQVDEVKKILDAKVKPDACGMDGVTALHTACNFDRVEVAKLLIEYGASPNVDAQTLTRPLHLAAEKGSVEMLQILIDAGADPLFRDFQGRLAKTQSKTKDAVKVLQAAERQAAERLATAA
jgi:ankyrin repeat protein